MKYWIHLLIVVIVSFVLTLFFPWWIITVVAMLSAYLLGLKSWTAAMFGIMAGFILWAGVALYVDVENQHILSTKMGSLFGGLNSTYLIAITGLIGGIIASLSSFIGASVSELKLNEKSSELTA